ncbi:MAG: hypothetical protein JSU85_14475, partial [Candidatus Zixiibacteriota bacterium]
NRQVENRKKYELSKNGIEAEKKIIKDISDKRKNNQAAKMKMVATARENFPHPGIVIDEKTVWVDLNDGKGMRTINDASYGEKLTICTHILIAGNTGMLNILLISKGSDLDSKNKKVIFDIAREYKYHVVMETIETTEIGALHIVKGRVDSIIQEKKDNKKDAAHVSKEEKADLIKQDDSPIKW